MIELRNLTFAYPRQAMPVFERLDWQVERGEAWAVIGPSGCGKSTLLYLIAGIRRPASGAVTLDGVDAGDKSNRGRVGLILQDYGLLPWATAWDNARLGIRVRRFYGRSQDGAPARLQSWLERLGIAGLRAKYPCQLSGGERQRVAIARALALEPEVLLLDEPGNGLDARTRAALIEILRGLDLSYILISHELDFITATTDTVYTLQNGKIRTDQELSVHQHVHAHPIGSCPHEHCPPE